MAKVLKRDVRVHPDGGIPPCELKVLPAGTKRADIPKSELDQLDPDHFTDG
jgi:hypothetical protein